jgi:glycosyltransferase involved in cell wall biosynthesis
LAETAVEPGRGASDLSRLKCVAIVPALNEERSIKGVIEELRLWHPDLEIVVVSDGSTDRTAEVAEANGAHVLRLPFNLGIGGAVQTGFRYAYENDFDLALRGEADVAIGSRFSGDAGYRSSATRRIGIRILAWAVSLLVRQRVTDTTSGFQALNRSGIALFARDYPHDYPEVEATVMVFKHELRLVEVPVTMREREHGRSSITALRSIYYMVKVLLALSVGIFRRPAP